MRSRGYTQVLVARADLLAPFEGKNSVVIGGTAMHILALLPLEPREWALKVEGGMEALSEDFRARRRDFLVLRSKAASAG